MQFADFQSLIKNLDDIGVFSIVIEGGEPSLHPQFSKMIELLNKIKAEYTIITNGTKIDNCTAALLSSEKCTVIVSLDSVDPQIHNFLRNHYQQVRSGLNNILQYNKKVGINTVLTKYNIDTYKDLVEEFYPAVKNFSLLRLIPRSRNDEVINNLKNYTEFQVERLQKTLISLIKQYPGLKIETPFTLSNDKSIYMNEQLDIPGCLAGTTFITIKPNLDVLPCSYCQEIIVGNLSCQSFAEIWKSQMLQNIRLMGTAPCLN